jgi:opacity protein-like surface antigen
VKPRYSIAGLVLAACGATPAFAQDDWTGPYVGVYTEAASSEAGFEDFGCWAACTKVTLQRTSLSGGVTAGFDAQIADGFVVGVLGDIGTGAKNDLVSGAGLATSTTGSTTFHSEVSRLGSIRARAGVSHGKALMYVTGGIGFQSASQNVFVRGAPVWIPTHSSNYEANWTGSVTGMTFGAGVEYKFSRFRAKAEILTTRFDTVSACYANSDGANRGVCWTSTYLIPPQLNVTSNRTSIRLGLNYRF